MKIILVDCDAMEGVTLYPNPWLMKTSSALKQRGDKVHLMVNGFPKEDNFDVCFIFKEKDTSFLPPPTLILSKKVRLVGKSFSNYPNFWKISKSIYGARPDYLIYKNFDLYPSDYACFSYDRKLIKYQDFQRNKHLKDDVVVIDDIWELEEDDLLNVLDTLSDYSHIYFLEPINFLRINDKILQKLVNLTYSKRHFLSKNITSVQDIKHIKNSIIFIKSKRRFTIGDILVEVPTEDKPIGFIINLIKIISEANKESLKIKIKINESSEVLTYITTLFSNYNQNISIHKHLFGVNKEIDYPPNLIGTAVKYIKENDYQTYRKMFNSWTQGE